MNSVKEKDEKTKEEKSDIRGGKRPQLCLYYIFLDRLILTKEFKSALSVGADMALSHMCFFTYFCCGEL